MSCITRDLTLDEALADPDDRRRPRADRVDRRGFETLLRSPARRLDNAARSRVPTDRFAPARAPRWPGRRRSLRMVGFFTQRRSSPRPSPSSWCWRGRSATCCCRSRSSPTSRRPRWWSAPSIPGASAQVVADTVTTPLEQQINGVQGMTYMSSSSVERRLVDHHGHVRCRLSARHRGRRRAEPRLAGGLLAARDRQPGRRDDQEAEPELRPDRQPDLARRLGRSGGAQQLRLSADRRSAEAAAGRRRRVRSSASGAIRCASGSIRTGSPSSASRRSTCRAPSPSRTCRSRPARSASRRRPPARPSRCRSTPSAACRPRAVRRHRRAGRSRQRLGRAPARRRAHRTRRAAICLVGLLRQGPDRRAGRLPDAGLERARPAGSTSRTRWTSCRRASPRASTTRCTTTRRASCRPRCTTW